MSIAAVIVAVHCTQAQTQQQSINTPALTTVLPPAPNAYEITKYSGLPVNMSTGSVSVSLPLGQVHSGKANLGISLSYNSGNGVSVNQLASRTGVSWALNAGGVITRSLYGKPDESADWISPPTDPSSGTYTTDYYNYLYDATNGIKDPQTDIFSFDFNGHSGKFILDPNNKTQAVMLAPTNLKIETNFHAEFPGDWTFRITDPQGTKYYFGGSQATEKSKTSPEGSSCGKTFDVYVPNAWYLISVQHYNGEYIWLQYVPCTFDYLADISQTLIRTPQGTLSQYSCPGQLCGDRIEDQTCSTDLRNSGVILKAINSKFESIRFSYSDRLDVAGDSLLTGVQFYRRGLLDTTYAGMALKSTYTLTYTYGTNSSYYNANGSSTALMNRPFLTSVAQSGTGMQTETHKMDYYNMNGLPSRLAFAQDYWGYFNGVNNTYLVPTNPDPAVQLMFPSSLADRSPNGSYSYYGLLRKITYPTAGTDSIVYEPNTIYDTRTIYPAPTTLSGSVTGTGTSTEVSSTYSFSTGKDQNISINANATYSGTGVNDNIHQHMFVDILGGSTVLWSDELNIDSSYHKLLSLSTGNYTLRIRADGQATVANASVTYTPVGTAVTGNYQVGGVRVAKNISTSLTGATLTKSYVYAALSTQAASSGRLRANADPASYYSILVNATPCTSGDLMTGVGICNYLTASSSPIKALNYLSGGHIFYANVIELRGSDWTNGGVEHQYIGDTGTDGTIILGKDIPGVPVTNNGMPIGMETLATTFFTTGGTSGNYTYKPVNTVHTHYVSDSRLLRQFDNYVVRKNWTPSTIGSPPNAGDFAPYDQTKYTLYSQWIYPDTVITTTYDLAGNNPVVNSQYDAYANVNHLQLTERKTIGSDLLTRTVDYKYPHDLVADGVTTPYQAMVDRNIIAPSIETLYSKDGVLQQGVKINYDSFVSGSVYEPASIQTKTTTGSYDTRVQLYDYNANGGLLAQSKYLGSKTSYLWGYSDLLPVAEGKTANTNEIYYEGFEYASSGVSTAYSHTGNQSNHSALTIGFTPPSGKTYFISWFQKNGTLWDYHKETYTGSKTFSATDYIDDVCIYPQNAQMAVYAYDPYIGLTASIDARGATTSYDYDNYQRLVNIRDLDGNILKNYQYNFNQSPPATVYYNAAQTQSFRKSCPGGFGSAVNYTVYAGTYSSVISQADADAQATADMTANGQKNANNGGACFTGNKNFTYENDANLSGGVPSAGISTLKFKDASGTVLYTFTESQLLSGISVPVGEYTLEFTTYGSAYDMSTHLGWSVMTVNSATIFNTGAPGNVYTLSNVDLTTASSWAITIGSAL